MRVRNGCDGPTADELHTTSIECAACRGRNQACTHCDGTGTVRIRRCVWKLLEPVHVEVIEAALLVEHGVLPAAGGWDDQTHTWREIYPQARNEIMAWRAVEQRRMAEKQQ